MTKDNKGYCGTTDFKYGEVVYIYNAETNTSDLENPYIILDYAVLNGSSVFFIQSVNEADIYLPILRNRIKKNVNYDNFEI